MSFQTEPRPVIMAPSIHRERGRMARFRIVEAIYPGMTQLDFTAPHTVFSRIPGAGEELQELIQFSTFPSVTARYETVGDFLEQLDKVEDKLTAPEKDTVDNPLDARVGDKLEGGFVVRGRLGSGSYTALLPSE